MNKLVYNFLQYGKLTYGGRLRVTEVTKKVWAKILQTMDENPAHPTGCAGCIPVYDGQWRVFRNALTIYDGAENAADPAKVDVLRQNVVDLLDHYPDTIKQLEKLGARVRGLLNRQIKTQADVQAWADSMFNSGPTGGKQPLHIHDTIDLAYDDIVIEVKGGRDPVYVIPAGPRGSGVNETIDFSVPGSKKRYGPRNEFTKAAFAKQVPKKIKAPRYRGKTAEGEPQRPRGRPRLDGLIPGSPEAKRADRKKQKDKERKRAARNAAKVIDIKQGRPKRRTLSRKADRQRKTASG